MSGGNLADVWEGGGGAQPEAPAVIQGGRRSTWSAFDARANGVAAALLRAPGIERQAKGAEDLYNSPESLATLPASWKAGLVPVNTNYRYTDDELVYLWDNADAVAVVFHGAFTG